VKVSNRMLGESLISQSRARQRPKWEYSSGIHKMAADLKQIYAGIEDTVRQRTRELSEKTELVQLLQTVAGQPTRAGCPGAISDGVDGVCAYTGWPVGHAYLLATDDSGRAEPTTSGTSTPSRSASRIRSVTGGDPLPPWDRDTRPGARERKPVWIPDVKRDPNFRARRWRRYRRTRGLRLSDPGREGGRGPLEFYSGRSGRAERCAARGDGQHRHAARRVIERERAARALRKV